MSEEIKKLISNLKVDCKNLTVESIYKMRSTLSTFATLQAKRCELQIRTRGLLKGAELYRDPVEGFVLLAYSENQDTYRKPHNHGNAWVIYALVSGEVEMGTYVNAVRADGSDRLIPKDREKLKTGDTRIYFSGEIHDTLCLSKNAVILRLTSLDLGEEEQSGRMKRYEYKEAKCL